jgi:uncharacterized protein with von Willebrand factor type A (vWA) domain
MNGAVEGSEQSLPDGLAPRIVAFCEELRREGIAFGTSVILGAFEALEAVPWTDRLAFRESLAATLAKSQEDRRIFELLFDRFFFRAAEAEALARSISEADRRYEGSERLDLEELRKAIRQAIIDGNEGEMSDLARLAIAALGRQGEGSGVVGVDVQRIRRTLGLQRGKAANAEGAPKLDPDAIRKFERYLRRELERADRPRLDRIEELLIRSRIPPGDGWSSDAPF